MVISYKSLAKNRWNDKNNVWINLNKVSNKQIYLLTLIKVYTIYVKELIQFRTNKTNFYWRGSPFWFLDSDIFRKIEQIKIEDTNG